MVVHAADVISKYEVGADGRIGNKRMKGKSFLMKRVRRGVPLQISQRFPKGGRELGGEMGERVFSCKVWRTGEAILGMLEGIRRAATIRRVGSHRRRDPEGLALMRGVPWSRNPDEDVQPGESWVRCFTEEEEQSSVRIIHVRNLMGPPVELGVGSSGWGAGRPTGTRPDSSSSAAELL